MVRKANGGTVQTLFHKKFIEGVNNK